MWSKPWHRVLFFVISLSFSFSARADGTYDNLIELYRFKDTSFFAEAYSKLSAQLTLANGDEKVYPLLCLGQIQASRKNDSLAQHFFMEALNIAKKQNNRQLIYLSYFKIGTYHYSVEAWPFVIKYLYAAKNYYSSGNWDNTYITLLRLTGLIENELKNHSLAGKTFGELVNILNKTPEKPEFATVYNLLGVYYTEKKSFDSALAFLKKAYTMRLKKGDSLAIAQSLENFGTLYRDQGELSTALKYYQRAYWMQVNNKAIFESIEPKVYMGIVYEKMGSYGKSLEYLKEALDYCDRTKTKNYLDRLLPHLASCYEAIGDYKNACFYLNRQKEFESTVKFDNDRDNLLRYNLQYSFEKKLVADSLRFNNEKLVLRFENEKQKRNNIIYLICSLLLAAFAAILYLLQKQRASLRIKDMEIRNLRTRMNPHFIFNALNSVMEYIRVTEKDKALQYLTKFSRLIRMVLESSNHKTISLAQEIEMLQHYVDLENLRFGNHFQFILEIDEALDPEHILVPALIIQPFVENAILHGLLNKQKLCFESKTEYLPVLQVSFQKTGKYLQCIVEDNGAGRKKAAEIKESRKEGHHSVGLRLTRERLQLLGGDAHKVVFTDLEDANKQSTGTRVEIFIILEESL